MSDLLLGDPSKQCRPALLLEQYSFSSRYAGGINMEMKKKIESKQVNKKSTSLVRIDAELHRRLKIMAATEKTSIKTLIEGVIAELLTLVRRNK